MEKDDLQINQKEMPSLEARLEAMLFVTGDPIRITRLANVTGVSNENVMRALQNLQEWYTTHARGFRVLLHADTVQLITAPNVAETVDHLLRSARTEDLSRAALEVLAIIAYRSPVSRAEIDAIRGVDCSFSLRNLLLRGLIERAPDPERPRAYVYTVTHTFLSHLGLTSITELPAFASLTHDPKIAQVTGAALHDEATTV